MAKEQLDQYPNIMSGVVTMSAANTITHEEINVGVNLFDKAALLIQRIEFMPTGAVLGDLDTDGDAFYFGLTQAVVTGLVPSDAQCIDMFGVYADLLGAVVSKELLQIPFAHDFSNLRGGGILIAPKPLYAVGQSNGLTVAGVFYWRIYMNIIRLESDQYLELLETRRAFG
jgi:hypothetical protein